MALAGRATPEGTARYAARFTATELSAANTGAAGMSAGAAPGHFRAGPGGLTLSSIGAGTYLGEHSDAVDESYRAAIIEAVRAGCNVLDTAVSYRAQRSELAVGRALADLVAAGVAARDELVIASKGGFIAHYLTRPASPIQYVYDNFVATGLIEPDDLAGGIHCIAPAYLAQQIMWSLRNLNLRTVDIYYIHNPETQLAFTDRATFRRRMTLAFARLEEEVAAGRIGCYGVATWEGLRRPHVAADYLGLEILVQLAVEAAGHDHHLRVVEVPVNPIMPEAATFRNQPVAGSLMPTIAAAEQLGLTVVASAALGQGQRRERVPQALAEAFPALPDYPAQALQFTRSLPGVCTALVGMGQPAHARANLRLAALPPEPEPAAHLVRKLPR
jgi:aryl-alcohol dehydrogenase-like predicted oxidoreductase